MSISDVTKLAVLLMLFPVLSVAGPSARSGALAGVEATTSGVNVVSLTGQALKITVSGPDGIVLEGRVAAGGSGYLQGEYTLPDGYYRYQIDVIPDRSAMEPSETNGENGRDALSLRARVTGPTVQSGGFRLMDGAQFMPSPDQGE